MGKGISRVVLRIDLNKKKITTESPSSEFYRTYFGGRGLIGYYLLKEVPKGIHPLSAENKLIFTSGPLVGSPLPGTGRNSVGGKSPLTQGFGDSEAGGFWGAELKKAGYDAIILEGTSNKPVYISIKDDKIKFLDATKLWGKKTAEVESEIKKELKDDRTRISQIGLAGEKLVSYACISNDLTHMYGRSGMGAVMGSKKVKAIAVRGSRKVELDNEDKVLELAKWMRKNGPKIAGLDLGTSGVVLALNEIGGLPTKNFQECYFKAANNICGETMMDSFLVSKGACYKCPIACKRKVKGDKLDPVYGGPEYETIAALGSLCGISSLDAICLGNQMCNAYGLDTISTGVCIAFAMECYEKGLLTKTDTCGIDLQFGNSEAMLQMIEQIAYRTGFGDVLALGVESASRVIGGEASEYAMHVNGQELPMHDPRLKAGLGIGYLVSPTGADHNHNLHDTAFENNVEFLKPLGILSTLPIDNLSMQKVRMVSYYIRWMNFANCAHNCIFVPWTMGQMVSMVKAVTGWDTSLWELMKVGERADNLARLFTFREKGDVLSDRLPKRFSEQFEKPFRCTPVERGTMQESLQGYFTMMGWDQKGKPGQIKMEELGIQWAVDYM